MADRIKVVYIQEWYDEGGYNKEAVKDEIIEVESLELAVIWRALDKSVEFSKVELFRETRKGWRLWAHLLNEKELVIDFAWELLERKNKWISEFLKEREGREP